jgi:hypothetical protein
MNTLAKKYLSTTIQLLYRIQDKETDAIEEAAESIADAIAKGYCSLTPDFKPIKDNETNWD